MQPASRQDLMRTEEAYDWVLGPCGAEGSLLMWLLKHAPANQQLAVQQRVYGLLSTAIKLLRMRPQAANSLHFVEELEFGAAAVRVAGAAIGQLSSRMQALGSGSVGASSAAAGGSRRVTAAGHAGAAQPATAGTAEAAAAASTDGCIISSAGVSKLPASSTAHAAAASGASKGSDTAAGLAAAWVVLLGRCLSQAAEQLANALKPSADSTWRNVYPAATSTDPKAAFQSRGRKNGQQHTTAKHEAACNVLGLLPAAKQQQQYGPQGWLQLCQCPQSQQQCSLWCWCLQQQQCQAAQLAVLTLSCWRCWWGRQLSRQLISKAAAGHSA